MLLSPRSIQRASSNQSSSSTYSCYESCCKALCNKRKNKPPPKFSIANGWAIGHLTTDISFNINEVKIMVVSVTRPHTYVVSFSGGQHKTIKGSCTFFNQNVSNMESVIKQTTAVGGNNNVYVVLCRRFTPDQRTLVRKRCLVNYSHYTALLNWLKTTTNYILIMICL